MGTAGPQPIGHPKPCPVPPRRDQFAPLRTIAEQTGCDNSVNFLGDDGQYLPEEQRRHRDPNPRVRPLPSGDRVARGVRLQDNQGQWIGGSGHGILVTTVTFHVPGNSPFVAALAGNVLDTRPLTRDQRRAQNVVYDQYCEERVRDFHANKPRQPQSP